MLVFTLHRAKGTNQNLLPRINSTFSQASLAIYQPSKHLIVMRFQYKVGDEEIQLTKSYVLIVIC